MKTNKPKAPKPPQLPALITGDFFFDDEANFSGLKVDESDQSYLSARNLVIHESEFKHIIMQGAQLKHFECHNVIFDHCDFSNIEWLGASFHQVHFNQCKLIGSNFAESYLRDCLFSDCLANLASFSSTNLRTVAFENCMLNETIFNEVNWKNFQLRNNQLSSSQWFLTKMTDLDLTTNFFDSIALSKDLIHGLKVNQEQAIIIAQGLGLIIE